MTRNSKQTTYASSVVILYGKARCSKTMFYLDELTKRQIQVEFKDIGEDKKAAHDLRRLYDDGKLRFPTLVITGKRLRNPTLPNLDKHLARSNLFDPGIIHHKKAMKFIAYRPEGDWFISYRETATSIALTYLKALSKNKIEILQFIQSVFKVIEKEFSNASIESPEIKKLLKPKR